MTDEKRLADIEKQYYGDTRICTVHINELITEVRRVKTDVVKLGTIVIEQREEIAKLRKYVPKFIEDISNAVRCVTKDAEFKFSKEWEDYCKQAADALWTKEIPKTPGLYWEWQPEFGRTSDKGFIKSGPWLQMLGERLLLHYRENPEAERYFIGPIDIPEAPCPSKTESPK